VAYSYPYYYFFDNFKNNRGNIINMSNDKINMPSGMGGLVRYFDEYRSKIEFKPGHIVILCIIVVIIIIGLHIWGRNII
jgi:preprotein translocase subunit Sec61beta